MYQPFAYMAAAAGGLPDIYTTGLEQWFAPELATSVSEFLTDQSGNARDGSSGGTQWNWDGSNNYVYLSSANTTDNVLNTDYHPSSLDTVFTLQIWAYMEAGGPSAGELGLLHQLQNTGNSANTMNLRASGTILKSQQRQSSNVFLTLNSVWNAWHMFTYSYDVNEISSGVKQEFFLDDGTTSVTANTTIAVTNSTGFFVGGKFDNNVNNYWADLKVGSIKVYSTALTSTEVSTNYNAEKAHYGL